MRDGGSFRNPDLLQIVRWLKVSSLAKNLLLSMSLVTLAVIVPLNSVILAHPDKPLCVSCLVIMYVTPILGLTLCLHFCERGWGGRLYQGVLLTVTLAALVFFLHVIEITTIPKSWRVFYAILSALGLLALLFFTRRRKELVTQFLLFALVLTLYEAVNFVRIAIRAESSSPVDQRTVELPPGNARPNIDHIFLIVFDEFPLMQVLKDETFDYQRVPNLAQFSGNAMWYRQAVTSHDETEWAIPALLTGRQDVGSFRQEFLEESRPHHLFQLTSTTHDVYISGFAVEYCRAFHAYVRACRTSVLGFSDVGFLFGHWWVRAVPGAFRGRYTDRLIRDTVLQLLGSLYYQRNVQSAFADVLRLGQDFTRPTFTYIHIALPHHPYVFRPNGDVRWDPVDSLWIFPNLPVQGIKEARDHCKEQITFTDGLLGQFLAQLKRLNLYDRALIIVTSDHGMSFDPVNPGRGTGWINEEIARIPLMIKMPGQRSGSIDDRPVSLIDLYPTIVEWLGQRADASDGVSLLARKWDLQRPLVTYSILCDRRACARDERHPRFTKTQRGWIPVPYR